MTARKKEFTLTLNCLIDGCERPMASTAMRCHFHEALVSARELSEEDLASLRSALVDVRPLTDEERAARRVRHVLERLTHEQKSLADSIASATKAGATEDQIVGALAKAAR